ALRGGLLAQRDSGAPGCRRLPNRSDTHHPPEIAVPITEKCQQVILPAHGALCWCVRTISSVLVFGSSSRPLKSSRISLSGKHCRCGPGTSEAHILAFLFFHIGVTDKGFISFAAGFMTHRGVDRHRSVNSRHAICF